MKDFTEGSAPWFDSRDKITNIEVGDGVTRIGDFAFYKLEKMENASVATTVTEIGKGAFMSCSMYAEFKIPDSVKTIGQQAFRYCSKLLYVILPNDVTSIGSQAFDNCNSLVTVTFQDNVQSVGESAFGDCSALSDVFYQGTRALSGDAFKDCGDLVICPGPGYQGDTFLSRYVTSENTLCEQWVLHFDEFCLKPAAIFDPTYGTAFIGVDSNTAREWAEHSTGCV